MDLVSGPIRQPRIHHDFDHDIPPPESLSQRVFLAILPIISLIRPIGRALTIGTSSLRLFFAGKEIDASLKKIANLALAVAAVAGLIFYNWAGMFIITTHDIILNVQHIFSSNEQVLESCKLINNIAYLTLLTFGSLELQIISLATQILFNLGSAYIEYKKGRYLEAGTNLFMSGIRFAQFNNYLELLNRRKKVQEAIRNIYVGKMKDKWQFPSDHLPIGIEVDGEFEVLSWNVMNNCYMKWVKITDSQGLNGSMLTELDVKVNDKGLTKRDLLVVDMLNSMTNKPKAGLIALQECGEPFLEKLSESLPKNWHIARSFDHAVKDQEVVLYNDNFVSFDKNLSKTPLDAYPSFPGRQLSQSFFRRKTDGKGIRIFNAHIPGDPNLPGPEEYAKYISNYQSSSDILIALGDCNFERNKMTKAFEDVGLLKEHYPEEVLHSFWPTNVHPHIADFSPGPLRSKAIDHALVLNAKSTALSRETVLNDERFFATIDHLQGKAS